MSLVQKRYASVGVRNGAQSSPAVIVIATVTSALTTATKSKCAEAQSVTLRHACYIRQRTQRHKHAPQVPVRESTTQSQEWHQRTLKSHSATLLTRGRGLESERCSRTSVHQVPLCGPSSEGLASECKSTLMTIGSWISSLTETGAFVHWWPRTNPCTAAVI